MPGASAIRRVRTYLELVKFEHTIFALPFALAGAVLAVGGRPPLGKLALAVVAVVFARTAAMAMNRYADAADDALNPRTRGRAVPAGLVSRRSVLALSLASAGLFSLTTYFINWPAFVLGPIALAVLLGYSYTKRFTWLCHFFLGLALGLAPVGASIAVAEAAPASVWLLGLGVLLWTAGFDIIYATQDYAFDIGHATKSLPKRFGIGPALWVSSACHAGAAAAFAAVGLAAGLGFVYFIGVLALAAVLAAEHVVVRPSDLSKVNLAFFTLNGFVSMGYLGIVIVETALS